MPFPLDKRKEQHVLTEIVEDHVRVGVTHDFNALPPYDFRRIAFTNSKRNLLLEH